MNVLQSMEYVTAQGERGRQRGMENAFRRDSMAALEGDPDAFMRQAAIDPAQAVQVQQAGDVNARRIRGAAKYMQQALESQNPAQVQGAWNAVRPYLSKVTGKGAPDAWDDNMRPAMEQLLAKTAYLETADANGMPAGFRQFEMTARAAGLKPGTPEYQQAANIALGREGRAATGGFSFEMFKGADGRERPGRQNPRTGETEIYNETTGNFEPIGAGRGLGMSGGTPAQSAPMGTQSAPMPPGGTQAALDQITASANQMIARGVPEAQVDAWVQQQANPAGGASTTPAVAPQMVQTGGPLPPAIDYQRGGIAANPGLGVSRTPEEQAALTARAQEEVEVGYLPERERIKTQAEIERARQQSQIERDDDTLSAAPGAIATLQNSLDSIDTLLASDELGSIVGIGSLNPLNQIPGTEARGLIARADQIAGQSFLAAFNQLKGGGAITEREGLARQNTGTPAPSTARRAVNPQTGEVLELRNGQWVPAR